MNIKFIILIAVLLFAGCSSQKDIIRDKVVTVDVPKISAPAVNAKPINISDFVLAVIEEELSDSSFYQAEHVTEKGDSIKIKFYPKKRSLTPSLSKGEGAAPQFEIEVAPAPVEYRYTDTTHVVQERKSFGDFVYYIIGMAALVLIVIGFLKRKN